ncbi:Serine/threonine protein kinase [Handroanthus impetiginosus]|uniref:non-specific serine/threonine protein kinase n=1 Tax=Handroanthus impetiginosus TaxID=429701 RepID=A0A2G9H114_9LAMI|nr:Serine/threonine protein kinase [Handroanthus impetiginosus]
MKLQEKMMFKTFLVFFILNIFWAAAKSQCTQSCDALASYYIPPGRTLTFISLRFQTTINNITSYNPQITNPDLIQSDTRINVPFSCNCINNDFMGHQFAYRARSGNTYKTIAELSYSNLTTVEMMTRFNMFTPENIPDASDLNVVVNCSCGNPRVSKDYGLFITYPLRPGENLSVLANAFGLPEGLLQDYNPGVDFSRGSGLVFIPGRGISGGAIAGISIGAIIGAVCLAACIYFVFYRRKKVTEESSLDKGQMIEIGHGVATAERTPESRPLVASASPKLKGITVDKSVEFTYEELAMATNDFHICHKIGQGGFGSVYYAKLRGEKAAIKKMDMQASKEFLAELKVLTNVHHVNLVRLIGYCIKGSLFLVYEYIDNGNLSQHLHGRETLPWSARLQIALDSARGLEYIHEHTVPVYIHRDIKSANILIDKNFHAKVTDFGLTKLIEVGSASLQTRLMGTFGYMAPEYGQFGEVSPKIDVYAFGVVLFELISAKEAVLKTNEVTTESKGLVALFDDAFSQPDQAKALRKLVDPRLGHDYPFDSVSKVAHLAKACTHENPRLRPIMRSIVVALTTLSSSSEDWDIAAFYKNQGLVHLMSGR